MKTVYFAILALLCLLQGASAQTQKASSPAVDDDARSILTSSEEGLTESTTTSDFDLTTTAAAAGSTSFIEDTLGLPIMRDQLTITESAQEVSMGPEDIDSSYGKMMQAFAATLEDYETGARRRDATRELNPLIAALIGFIVEIIITLIVLKIAFRFSDYRFRFQQILPLSIAVAVVGALLGTTLEIGRFNPARIGLSFIIMLVLLRLMTDVHEWATVIQMTLTTRLVSLGMTWLVFMGMMVLFGL